MIIREFKPDDLKRVFEIENMSFDQSYGINMFKGLYDPYSLQIHTKKSAIL